jgi:hypothetical protein
MSRTNDSASARITFGSYISISELFLDRDWAMPRLLAREPADCSLVHRDQRAAKASVHGSLLKTNEVRNAAAGQRKHLQ